MVKRLTSVFTDNMDNCILTGSPYVERHHIFGGCYRGKSEEYGFVVPLRYDLHPNGARVNPHYRQQVDDYLKKMAQEYFESHYGSREEFRRIFGRSYL
ncbi:hypothetical protein ACPW7J_02055 [Ihubacter sp. rT4E-8]|uniref:hypothetical protein n=1 Tax=Ihubacter sp. rT4E-8 TaxID=3242369 RepID=UPI003CF3D689